MSSVVDKLTSVGESILSLPLNIVKGIGELFSDLLNWLDPFSEDFILAKIINWLNPFSEDFILKIFFDWLTNLLGIIFIPNTEELKLSFNAMLDSISSSFGISFDSIEEFSNTWQEKPVENIVSDYNINGVGTLKLKFLDTTYLIQGVNKFRPIIRGFVVLLLILYNYYQILTFIGQDPRIQHTAEQAAEKHLSRKEK